MQMPAIIGTVSKFHLPKLNEMRAAYRGGRSSGCFVWEAGGDEPSTRRQNTGAWRPDQQRQPQQQQASHEWRPEESMETWTTAQEREEKRRSERTVGHCLEPIPATLREAARM